jgi:TolB protein
MRAVITATGIGTWRARRREANTVKIKVQCMRSGTTVLAAVVALAAAAASACGVEPGSGARAGLDTAGLGAGQVGTRAQVPWRSVGPGWALAEYSASTVPGVKPAVGGPTTLYLIDPRGGRYTLYRWSNRAIQLQPQLVDWSGDKTRALFFQPEPRPPWRLVQITLATGAVSAFKIGPNETVTGYTKPDGLNILATLGLQRTRLVRLNLSGQPQAVLTRGANLSAIQSPDGTAVAVSATGGLTLVSNAGGVIRRLQVPGDAGAQGCTPGRWWDTSTILARCLAKGSLAFRLWLIPAGGGAATALTPQRSGHGTDPYGDIGAWQLSSGLYLQALGPCGTVFIVRQASDGSLKVINIPGAKGNNNSIVTAYGPKLLVQAQTGCPGSNSLLWFNPETGAAQMVLKAPNDMIGAFAEVPYVRVGG